MPGGRAGGVRAEDRRGRGGEHRGVLRDAREIDALDVARRLDVEAGLGEHRAQARGLLAVGAGDDERRAVLERVGRVRRAAETGDGPAAGAREQ